MIGRIVIVGVQKCALLCSTCDLKAAQMSLQLSLIWELMLYEFKLGHDTPEETKNIHRVKDEN